MEVIRTLADPPHHLRLLLFGRSADNPSRFGGSRLGSRGASHLGGALLTELLQGSVEFLSEGLLTLLALDESFALGQRERVVPVLLQGCGTIGAPAELFLHLAVTFHGSSSGSLTDGLLLITGIAGLVLLLVGIGILTVDVVHGREIVDLAERLEHVLILAAQVVADLRLRQFGVQVLRSLHRGIADIGLLRVEEVDEEITGEEDQRVQDGREDVFPLPEINLAELFHLLCLGLVSWCVSYGCPSGPCPVPTGRLPSAAS